MSNNTKESELGANIKALQEIRESISSSIRDAVVEARHLASKGDAKTLSLEKTLIKVDQSLRIMEDIFSDVFRVLLYEVKFNSPDLLKEMEFMKNSIEVFARILVKKGIFQQEELLRLATEVSVEMIDEYNNKEKENQEKAAKTEDLN